MADYARLDVKLQDPPDLSHAMNLAREFKRKQMMLKEVTARKGAWQSSKNNFSPNMATSTPPLSTGSIVFGGNKDAKSVSSSTPFIKNLSREEMAERRAKGLCYNCDNPYTVGHQCNKTFLAGVG